MSHRHYLHLLTSLEYQLLPESPAECLQTEACLILFSTKTVHQAVQGVHLIVWSNPELGHVLSNPTRKKMRVLISFLTHGIKQL